MAKSPRIEVEASIVGADSLMRVIREVGPHMQFDGAIWATRKASYVLRDELKQRLMAQDDPSTSNKIYENVATKFATKNLKRHGNVQFRTGIMPGAKSPKNKEDAKEIEQAGAKTKGGAVFYWRFLEFGTKHISARNFARPTLPEKSSEATSVFVDQYFRRLNTFLRQGLKGKYKPTKRTIKLFGSP